MENPDKSADGANKEVAATNAANPLSDREVVKAARMILGHFPGLSKQAAYALLEQAAKRKIKI